MQSEMTNKNFELDLNNIKLSDIFSSWVTWQYLPAPIVNTQWKSEIYNTLENEIATKEWALEHLFKAKWLSYEKQNDLVAFLWYSEDRENLFIWRWDSYTAIREKIQARERIVEWNYQQALKDLKVAQYQLTWDYWNYKDLESHIWELEIFISDTMNSYPWMLANTIDNLPR